MTEEQAQDIEFVKSSLIYKISELVENCNQFKDKLNREVMMSVIYLKIFSAYLKDQKFETLESAWKFMNDIKGIIEKVFYVNEYLDRFKEASSKSNNK